MKLTRPVNILLIEDIPRDVWVMQKAFQEARIDVHLDDVMDGLKAKHILRKKTAYEDRTESDLMLLNLNFPKLDVSEVLETKNSDDNLKRVPVVIPTASNAKENIISYNIHVNSFPNKPMDFKSFF